MNHISNSKTISIAKAVSKVLSEASNDIPEDLQNSIEEITAYSGEFSDYNISDALRSLGTNLKKLSAAKTKENAEDILNVISEAVDDILIDMGQIKPALVSLDKDLNKTFKIIDSVSEQKLQEAPSEDSLKGPNILKALSHHKKDAMSLPSDGSLILSQLREVNSTFMSLSKLGSSDLIATKDNLQDLLPEVIGTLDEVTKKLEAMLDTAKSLK